MRVPLSLELFFYPDSSIVFSQYIGESSAMHGQVSTDTDLTGLVRLGSPHWLLVQGGGGGVKRINFTAGDETPTQNNVGLSDRMEKQVRGAQPNQTRPFSASTNNDLVFIKSLIVSAVHKTLVECAELPQIKASWRQ